MPKTAKTEKPEADAPEVCPKCANPLGPVTETPTGKRLMRCSKGTWNPETRQTEGCDYVKWLETPPEKTDEACPKCNAPVIIITTRFGKRAKKCSTAGWDREKREATGCDYIEWINKTTTEEIDEDCPQCGSKLVKVVTANGKRLKKCSTNTWNRQKQQAEGCTYVEWMNASPSKNNGDEHFPAEPL